MPTWKKVVVSGSGVSQLANDANYLIDAQSGAILTGSFSGSFQGDGSQLSGIATSLAVSGSTGNDSLNLKTEALNIVGDGAGISTSVDAASNTISIETNGVVSGSSQVNITGTTGYTTYSGSVKTYTDEKVSAVSASLATEKAARILADSDLQNSLDSEISTRAAAVTSLQSDLDTEETARIAGDTALQSNITALSGSAHNQREALQADLGASVSSLSGSAHTQRRAIESSLNTKITTEKNRVDAILASSDADKDSFAEIVTLINSVDTENDTAFAGYVTSSNARQTSIENSVTALSSSAAATDVALQANIDAEETARIAADNTLQGNIDSEASTRSAADTTLQSNIDSEASTRAAADTTLQGNIDSEASTRAAADTTLQGNIDTLSGSAHTQRVAIESGLTSDYQAADAALSSSAHDARAALATAQSTAYIAADTALSSSVATAIGTEQARIDAILSASSADKDSFAEIVTLINSVDTENDQAFAGYVTSSNARQTAIEGSVTALSSSAAAANASLSSDLTSAYQAADSSISASFATTIANLTNDYTELINIPAGIVSGSEQQLANLVGQDVVANSFAGDGSQLTNITVDQSATVASTFTNVSSTVVTHNFSSKNVNVVVYDSSDRMIIPASVTLTSDNQVTVEFAGNTSGRVVVAKGGHIVSGSISSANVDGFSEFSSSVDARIDALDGTFATDADVTALSSSAAAANTSLSSSIATTVSGLSQTLSVSGSTGTVDLDLKTEDLTIVGDGSGITTSISGNTVSVLANGLVSSSAQVVGKLSNQNVNLGSGNVSAASFTGNGANLTNIPLGTATTGDYVDSLVAGTGVTITNNSGEGATPTIATAQDISDSASPTFDTLTLTGDLNVAGTTTTTNQTTLTVSDSKIFLADGNAGDSLDSAIVFNYNDGVDDTAGIFRDATDGSITFFGAYTGSDAVGNTIDVNAAGYELATIKAGEFDGALSWTNVTDKPDPEITVNLLGDVAGTGVTTLTDLQDGIINISSSIPANTNLTLNDLVIDGNLTVTGTTTETSVTTVSSDSPLVVLNTSASGNPDVGLIGKYDSSGTELINGFFRDATDGVWKVFDGSTQSISDSALIDTSNAGFSLGTIQAAEFDGAVDFSNLQNVPDPTITINTSGDLSGSASTTLTDLADGVLSLNLTIPSTNNQTFNNLSATGDLNVTGDTNTDNLTATGNVSGNTVSSTGNLTVGGDAAVTGDITADSLTLSGNLIVNGTTTTVNSTQIELGDNILELNGTGSAFAGLKVNDNNGPLSGSLLWDGTANRWIAGGEGSEATILLANGDNVVSSSAQVNITDTTGYTAFSQSIDTHLDAVVSGLNAGSSDLSGSAHTQRVALFTALSSSVDAHLDANVSSLESTISNLSSSAAVANANLSSDLAAADAALSSSAHVQREAIKSGLDNNISSLSGSAHVQRAALDSAQTTALSNVSGAFAVTQAAQDVRLGDLEAFSSSLDSSFATEAEVTSAVDTLSGSAHTQRAAIESSLSSDISAEETRALAAEGVLQGNINTAISAAVTGDNTLQTNINSEASTRAAADTTLQSNIDSEESARIAADSALSSSIATTISNLSSTISISGSTGNSDVNLVTDDLSIVGVSGQTQTTVSGTTVSVGFVQDPTVSGNLTVTGDLTVTGNTFEAQVTNLNVEDRFILLNSGSNTGDAGIIFGGSDGTANVGSGIFFDNPAGVFGFSQGIGSTDTSATHQSKIGNIETSASAPAAAPTFQGAGTIHVDSSSGDLYIYS